METLEYNHNIAEFRIEKTVTVGTRNFTAYFIHDYYPTRFKDVDDDIKRVRRLVYDFKDGRNSSTVGAKIANAISRKNLHLDNTCICVIPASTGYKTQNRYSEFCKVVAGATGIQNGFSYITNRVDRDEMKGQSGGDKISTFDFHSHLYRGKTVVLFDDVYTSGTSFRQMAEKLIKTGANNVIGIFLAKTYSDYVHYVSPEEAGFYDDYEESDFDIEEPEIEPPDFDEPDDFEEPDILDEFDFIEEDF